MSAQLQDGGAVITTPNSFHARLALAAGVSVVINAPTLADLSHVVGRLQPTEAANEGNAAPAAKAAAGKSATQTTASSATPAAAQGGEAGNAHASTATPGSAQPAASGSVPSGEAGNASAAAQPAASSAQTASTGTQSGSAATAGGELPADEKEAFEVVKKVFLALGSKAGGRDKCMEVLTPFGLSKLSEAKPEQYAAILAALKKASA